MRSRPHGTPPAHSSEENLAAGGLRRLVDASGKRHDEIAAEVGVTHGAVGHWYRGVIPVPAGRAASWRMPWAATLKICVACKKLAFFPDVET